MPIKHNDIPSDLRIPLAYIEFDNSRANQGAVDGTHRRLLFGQKLSSGSAAANTPRRVTGPDQGDQLWGRGSMLANMCRACLEADPFIETWAIGLDDDDAAVAAAGSVEITNAPTDAGTLSFYVAGTRIRVGVASDDTTDTVATNLKDAINANTALEVTAAINGTNSSQVDITARNKGEAGNDIDLRLNYYQNDELPAGLQVTVTEMTSGSANPDMADAIAAMPEEQFRTVVMPYTDTANLDLLAAELEERFGPVLASDGVAYAGYRGTHSETATFGDGRNDHVYSYLPTGASPTSPWIFAAATAAVASFYLNNDPARPLQTLEVPGVLPPESGDEWKFNERNLLLYDGISSWTVNAAGRVQIEALITNYQVNDYGVEDPSYLYVNTPATLSVLRYRTRAWVTQTFPRHKLRADGEDVPAGQPIVTPSIFRDAYYGGVAEPAEQDGLIENADELVANMLLEIDDSNPNQLKAVTGPDLVNQFRLYTETMQFRV